MAFDGGQELPPVWAGRDWFIVDWFAEEALVKRKRSGSRTRTDATEVLLEQWLLNNENQCLDTARQGERSITWRCTVRDGVDRPSEHLRSCERRREVFDLGVDFILVAESWLQDFYQQYGDTPYLHCTHKIAEGVL